MSVSIFETLQNADYNINKGRTLINLEVGRQQLHNATVLLEKGYSLHDLIDPILEEYDDVEDVPEKD